MSRKESRRREKGDESSGKQSRRRRGADPPKTGGASAAEWLKTFAITIVLLIVIRTFLVQTFVIISGSMEDTLLVGDFLMVNRLAFGSRIPGTDIRTPGYSEPRFRDVVIFDPQHEDDMSLVKRIVGLPGDTLEMRQKELYRNGELQEEPFVKWTDFSGDHADPMMGWQFAHLAPGVDVETYRPTRDNWGPLVVPSGHYFMLGDNRDQSLDSRFWGLVEDWRVQGRAMFFYFSYDRDSTTPFAVLREVRWDRIGRRIQ